MRILSIFILLFLLPLGCEKIQTATSPIHLKQLTKIKVTPDSITLKKGETERFSATGYDEENKVIDFVPSWSVSGEAGNIEAATGFFTATKEGTCQVIASADSVKGTAQVTVVKVAPSKGLARIAVMPESITLKKGQTNKFTAVGFDEDNFLYINFLPIWSVSGDAGTMDTYSGNFTAEKEGSCEVKASSGTIEGKASVIVTGEAAVNITSLVVNPPYATVTIVAELPAPVVLFTATGIDKDGNKITITPSWSLSPLRIGFIDGSGKFTASSTGQGTVTASYLGVQGIATIVVEEAATF